MLLGNIMLEKIPILHLHFGVTKKHKRKGLLMIKYCGMRGKSSNRDWVWKQLKCSKDYKEQQAANPGPRYV